MKEAISETGRRRIRQKDYNLQNGITPETVKKNIAAPIGAVCEADYVTVDAGEAWGFSSPEDLAKLLRKLRKEMERAARKLDFEQAAEIRDRLLALEKIELSAR
jgi:excinuclease ABC subunit B